jgi:hypothetical protein
MTRFHGQILRTLGIFIEMLGMLVLFFRTKTDGAGVPLPGAFSLGQAWTIIGCGFVIWLFGSVVIYWPRSPRNESQSAGARADEGNLKL